MPEQALNNPDYLQHHPDAIQDSEMAHEVALAGKASRDSAARNRRISNLALELASQEGNYGTNVSDAFEKSLQSPADNLATRQRENTLTVLAQLGNNPERVVRQQNERANGDDETAEWYEERAAAQYDARK